MKRLVLAALLAFAAPALADSAMPPAYWADRQLPDPRREAQAKALMEELRCVVCQGQSIADSDAGVVITAVGGGIIRDVLLGAVSLIGGGLEAFFG